MFGFSFDFFNNEIGTYEIEIKFGTEIQRQQISGNLDMVKIRFIQLVKEIGNNNTPIRLIISKPENIWIEEKKSFKTLINKIQFANKSYMNNFPDEFKEK